MAFGSAWIGSINAARPLELGSPPRFATASVFPADWPASNDYLVNRDGVLLVRAHLTENCHHVTSGANVLWRWIQETARMGRDRAIWLKNDSGGRTHRLHFYDDQVMVRPERAAMILLECSVSGAALEANVQTMGAISPENGLQ